MFADSYSESVRRLMAMNSDALISNGQPLHAAALFECFFLNAQQSVKILCKNLLSEVFDRAEILAAASFALRKGVDIEVIVQERPPDGSVFFKMLHQEQCAGQTNVKIWTDANVSPAIKARKENFAVMDDRAFRYEEDSSKCEAVASMNRPMLASKLAGIFVRLRGSLDYGAAC